MEQAPAGVKARTKGNISRKGAKPQRRKGKRDERKESGDCCGFCLSGFFLLFAVFLSALAPLRETSRVVQGEWFPALQANHFAGKMGQKHWRSQCHPTAQPLPGAR